MWRLVAMYRIVSERPRRTITKLKQICLDREGGLSMKRLLNILIIVCVLLTASSLKAEDKPLPENQGEIDTDDLNTTLFYQFTDRDFLEIKVFNKQLTRVIFEEEDAKSIGLDEKELTDYLRLRIRNNFANIKIEEPDFDKYTEKQIGLILLRVWVVGNDYPVLFHLGCRFYHSDFSQGNTLIWEKEMMRYGSRDNVPDKIKKVIDGLIQDLAILFFKVRGEL